jgi:hypothetical protein
MKKEILIVKPNGDVNREIIVNQVLGNREVSRI